MKKISIFTSFFLLVVVAKAQLIATGLQSKIAKQSNSWNLAGNNNANTSSKLGTTNAVDLRFFTNNLERMRITCFGNIGIGTTLPQQKLDVNGNINIAGGFGLYVNNERVIHAFKSNFFAGQNSGTFNTDGYASTGIGAYALYKNTTGAANTANGYFALHDNTTGIFNTGIGAGALNNNTTGYGNTGNALGALSNNRTGNYNTAVGLESLFNNIDGSNNTGIGFRALDINVHGYLNTAIGFNANANQSNFSNSTAIGSFATVSASNQVRFGDNNITSIGGYVDWTNISDGRVKKNIKENVPGLTFINKLKPVTYNLNLDAANKIVEGEEVNEKYSVTLHLPELSVIKDGDTGKVNIEGGKTLSPLPEFAVKSDDNLKGSSKLPPSLDMLAAIKMKEQVVYTGFVAQDVEKAAKELNYDFSGVDAAKNDKDLYGLRYAQFVVPLVKAVQELSTKNDEKDRLIGDLQRQIDELKLIVSGKGNSIPIASSIGYLKQNTPNPSNNNTIIGYFLPDNSSRAQIRITDAKGSTAKSYNAFGGENHINIRGGELPAGIYTYTLFVNDKSIDSKQMVIIK